MSKQLGVTESGTRIYELDAARARALVQADSLPCMVHLDLSFRLSELNKYEKTAELDCHLVCAMEEGSSDISGLILYRSSSQFLQPLT